MKLRVHTPTRYVPSYRTHPVAWRLERFAAMVDLEGCPQCDHERIHHFYDRAFPEYSFCQMPSCNCDEGERSSKENKNNEVQ